MEKLKSMDQYNEVIQNELTVLMFSADWCPDCRFIDPFLPELEQENDWMNLYYVDRDEFIDLCADLSVFGIPSFVAFHKGEETGRFVSKDRKTKEEIQEFLNGIKR
ncbi:thiol reductase thioredoxin [Bacillus mangrovi]|uniref:Thiol reductase thioredoxin n=1 Tax=Metabacillus mangrovi TaxID=1491830 RepID=A0A7X2V713_9BACI|nr:thioredoxin family protein [Metabacillus mangrovi]MTH55636.1 thiol reductase thioredoxin [Metabacillus mangrovi]